MLLIRKIIFLFAIAISILIIREFISIYTDLRSIDEYLGYSFIILISILLIYFAFIPLIKILLMPRSFSPSKNISEKETIIKKRLKKLETNKFIQNINFNTTSSPELKYNDAIKILEEKTNQVRQVYISRIFYSTTISQNGFLDAIIILSASINLIKEIFVIYNGRVSNKDLFSISRKIYTAVAIGGSEGVEYATDEIITSLASDGLKSIPFVDKIMGSIADGFVNAMLITRVSYITENYCKLVYIKNDKDLLPSFKVVYDTAKLITSDVRDKIKITLKNMSTENKVNFAKFAVNPAGYVIDKAINIFGSKINDDTETKNRLSNTMKITFNPLGFGLEKIVGLFNKKKIT